MGNASALHTLDNLVYLRVWTASEVAQALEAIRRRKTVMALDREQFSGLFAVRSPDVARVFADLDTDFDGKVDTFEVLLLAILWCQATWLEKLDLLFRCFDFNAKGFLLFPELLLMASTASNVLRKFARLQSTHEDFAALSGAASVAFGGDRAGQLGAEGFGRWFDEAALPQELKAFVDEHASVSAPEAVEAPMRKRVRLLDYGVQELAQKVAHIRDLGQKIDAEDVDRAPQQQQQYEVLQKSLERTLAKLAVALETMKFEVAELASSLNNETRGLGGAALAAPATKLRHDHLLKEVEVLQRQSSAQHDEAAEIIVKLIEFTFGLPSSMPTAGPSRTVFVPDSLRRAEVPDTLPGGRRLPEDPEMQKRHLRVLDRELRKKHIKKPAESTVQIGEDGTLVVLEPGQRLPEAMREAQEETPPSSPGGGMPPVVEDTEAPVASEAAAGEEPPEGEDEEALPVVVAFADFDPPTSQDTQMLTLRVGDEVTATGQDGQGWWYGRKKDGSEGWFPPSYVQLREEPGVAEGA